ncbi:hypothetical protein QAD02_006331 [Eretmocerus hayati]|uniref:Uncharacterized protein n=1 Tax=Eretmocerus hayati TaxID=131215 RepID=A0ACC2N2X3_9HYME|nr:hypothetical protein QAD02_006331 [Eretmocerus hayati]
MKVLFIFSIIVSLTGVNRVCGGDHNAKVPHVLEEFLKQVEILKTELQDVLSKREHVDSVFASGLSGNISSKLDQHPVIVGLKSTLEGSESGPKNEECRKMFDSLLKKIIIDLDDTVIAKAEENLSVIDDSLALIKKDLSAIEKKIQNELSSPGIQAAICQDDNNYCHLLDEIADELDVNMSILDNLKQALPSMVKVSLYYIDNEEVTDKIKRRIAVHVKRCLGQ